MKSNYLTTSCLRRHLGRAVGAAGLLLLGLSATGQVTPKSPLGIWDCVMSGPRQGLAQITFFDDGTFTNYEILVPKPQTVSIPDPNQRGDTGDTGRTVGGGSTNSTTLPPHNDIAGFLSAGGPWGFDMHGRTIGYWYEISQPTYTTNTAQISTSTNESSVFVGPSSSTNFGGLEFCLTAPAGVLTNGDGSINSYLFSVTCFSNIVTANAITNAVSFVATVVPGKRITLLASSPQGNATLRGVADAPMPDLTGTWYGLKQVGVLWYNEFFSMTPSALGPNIYDVQGGGPAYQYVGEAFYFPQKQMAMGLGLYPVFPAPDTTQAAPTTRAVNGPLNAHTLGGVFHGLEVTTGQSAQRLSFSVQKQ